MKSITAKVGSLKRPGGSKVACILHNMFGSVGKRVLAEAEEENNSQANNTTTATTTTTVSDIISLDKKNKNSSSSRGKFLSHVFRKEFVIDGARKSKLLLLRRISAKRRAAKREEGSNGVNELCKRRILMGMKCKPVNASGKLHYGQDGVIVHEE